MQIAGDRLGRVNLRLALPSEERSSKGERDGSSRRRGPRLGWPDRQRVMVLGGHRAAIACQSWLGRGRRAPEVTFGARCTVSCWSPVRESWAFVADLASRRDASAQSARNGLDRTDGGARRSSKAPGMRRSSARILASTTVISAPVVTSVAPVMRSAHATLSNEAPAPASGTYSVGFAPVAKRFASHLRDGTEVGAGLCVFHRGGASSISGAVSPTSGPVARGSTTRASSSFRPPKASPPWRSTCSPIAASSTGTSRSRRTGPPLRRGGKEGVTVRTLFDHRAGPAGARRARSRSTTACGAIGPTWSGARSRSSVPHGSRGRRRGTTP